MRTSHLTALRRKTVVAAAFAQLVLVFIMYVYVAAEPAPSMTAAEEFAADATEGRAVLVCLGLIAVLAVVQLVVGWPTVRAKIVADQPAMPTGEEG